MSMIIDGTNGLTFNNATTQASAGAVLQTVSAGLAIGQNSTTSISFVSSPLTVSITPKFSTSKILIIANSVGLISSSSYAAKYTIYRNSTNLGSAQGMTFIGGGTNQDIPLSLSYLDSPATTSSTTYTVYFSSNNASGTAYLGDTIGGVSPTSSITLMEIAQ